MTTDRHYIYALTVNETPFYVGYLNSTGHTGNSKRTLQTRLSEHIYESAHPNSKQIMDAIIRGEETAKAAVINANPGAIDIVCLEEAPLDQPLDESEWITLYREKYDLTNILSGSIWLPVIPTYTLESYTPKAKPKNRTSKPLPPSINPHTAQETYYKMFELWLDSMDYGLKIGCEPEPYECYWKSANLHQCYDPTEAALVHKSFMKKYKKSSEKVSLA